MASETIEELRARIAELERESDENGNVSVDNGTEKSKGDKNKRTFADDAIEKDSDEEFIDENEQFAREFEADLEQAYGVGTTDRFKKAIREHVKNRENEEYKESRRKFTEDYVYRDPEFERDGRF